ncbi:unnamed protein product [Staurois parvus]|uniref:Uncharacterized protein n=1 Tax=Staurois parvus TaxID=386267 RepID=A0ABN9HPZ1_9NEOB|nr:unnamed protein product [Staurois parvus]
MESGGLHPGRREVSALESGGSQTSCVLVASCVPYFGKSLQETDGNRCTSQKAEYGLMVDTPAWEAFFFMELFLLNKLGQKGP